MIRVGVDVGGTFTDIILENQGASKNAVTVTKVPSTPHDQSEGVIISWNDGSNKYGD